jgi:N utilization substance protein A
VHGERYDHGQRIKAIITDVSNQAKGPSIIVSRRSPELIRALFELEVPEIADGLVEIQNVAREPGYRSKIAVVSHASGVDPVGACVGPRGSRVRMVVSELRGEKIDIIPFNEEPARFVAKALSPARVREVLVDDEAKQATVIVPDDQLSLAIGKDGLNARLAARLTGWRVDIRSETEFAEEESEMGYAEEDVSGRCACILANGKRCPNASLPGSRYCGLPAHQALEGTGTDYLVPPEEGEGEEVGDEPAADGELAASGNGELPAEELGVEAAGEEASVEEATAQAAPIEEATVEAAAAETPPVEEPPVEDSPVEDVPVEEPPVEEPAVEDAAAADQPLDEEPVDEAEPVAEDEPADAEGEAAVAEDEPLAEDEPAADEPEDESAEEGAAEEGALASAEGETPAGEAEES